MSQVQEGVCSVAYVGRMEGGRARRDVKSERENQCDQDEGRKERSSRVGEERGIYRLSKVMGQSTGVRVMTCFACSSRFCSEASDSAVPEPGRILYDLMRVAMAQMDSTWEG